MDGGFGVTWGKFFPFGDAMKWMTVSISISCHEILQRSEHLLSSKHMTSSSVPFLEVKREASLFLPDALLSLSCSCWNLIVVNKVFITYE